MVGGRTITPKVNTTNLMSSDRAHQNVAIHWTIYTFDYMQQTFNNAENDLKKAPI